jgi:hypothetical protein
MAGTLLMLILFFVLPPQYKLMVLSASLFPIFLITGIILFIFGKCGVANDSKILSQGIETPAIFTRILPYYGRRPVSPNSTYAAEVALDVDGKQIFSKIFFYGTDFRTIENLINTRQTTTVLFLPAYPNRVLFAKS